MSTGQVILSTWLFCASSLVSVFWCTLMYETQIFVPGALFHMCSLKTTLRSASDLLSSLLVFLFLDQVTMPLTTFQDLYFHFISLLFPHKVGDQHCLKLYLWGSCFLITVLQGHPWEGLYCGHHLFSACILMQSQPVHKPISDSLSFISLSNFSKWYNSYENLEGKIQKCVKWVSSRFSYLMIKASILSSVLYLCAEFTSLFHIPPMWSLAS